MIFSRFLISVLLLLSAISMAKENTSNSSAEFVRGLGPFVVDAAPKMDKTSKFTICIAELKVDGKNVSSSATAEDGNVCPGPEGFTGTRPKKNSKGEKVDNVTNPSRLVGDADEVATWNSRKWKYQSYDNTKWKKIDPGYVINPHASMQYVGKADDGQDLWDGICVATVITDDDPKNVETALLACDYRGVDVKDDGNAYLHCPKIQECYDTRYELKKPVAIGTKNGEGRFAKSKSKASYTVPEHRKSAVRPLAAK